MSTYYVPYIILCAKDTSVKETNFLSFHILYSGEEEI